MAAKSSNPLVSSQKSSQLQAILHPLVLLTVSDYITRHTLRKQEGPVIGALLGQQNGREITIEHAFECHTREAPGVKGDYMLDDVKFGARLEQMVTVHKERQLEFVGWYTLLPTTGPTPTILPIHNQILQGWNESAVLLGFHPEEVLQHSVGGKLPLTIYESNLEVDDPRDGEDKKMLDEDEPPLKLKFREVPYSIETDETEMISMNYVATGGTGTASTSNKEERPARSIESTGKGKRRLVQADSDVDEDDIDLDSPTAADLSREEDEMVASLTAKVNAIKMLQSRIRLITTYLERLPAGDEEATPEHTKPSLPVLRQIQALVNRLDLVIPSDKQAFEEEMAQESNNVHLLEMLNTIMQSVSGARDVGRKHAIVEASKHHQRNRSVLESGYLASPGFIVPGSGDILI